MVVAVEEDTGVVRLQVRYGDPVEQTYLDLWVVRFDPGGRSGRQAPGVANHPGPGS